MNTNLHFIFNSFDNFCLFEVYHIFVVSQKVLPHLSAVSVAFVTFFCDSVSFCCKYNNQALRSFCPRIQENFGKSVKVLVTYKTDHGSFQILRSRRFCLNFSLKINVASQYSSAVKDLCNGRNWLQSDMCLRSTVEMKCVHT